MHILRLILGGGLFVTAAILLLPVMWAGYWARKGVVYLGENLLGLRFE